MFRLFVFLSFLFPSVFLAQETDGLKAYFSFEEKDLKAFSSSVGDYTLQPRQGEKEDFSTVDFAEGPRGQALYLKKGNKAHYCLPPGILSDLSPPFTIAIWIKKTEIEPKHGIFCATCADTKDFGFEFTWFWRATLLRWGQGQEKMIGSPHGSLTLDKWHHVAATHDGNCVTLYIDAVAVAKKKFTTGFNPVPEEKKKSHRFTVGHYPTNFNAYQHTGMIDDVYIFAKALNKNEIFKVAMGKYAVTEDK